MQYADDANGIVQDVKSAKRLLDVIGDFGLYSGLKINKDKSEAMWLGINRNNKKRPLGIKWTDGSMKILGTYIAYDSEASYNKNTKERLKDIRTIINLWKMRNLTLIGKIQIVKSFLISKF